MRGAFRTMRATGAEKLADGTVRLRRAETSAFGAGIRRLARIIRVRHGLILAVFLLGLGVVGLFLRLVAGGGEVFEGHRNHPFEKTYDQEVVLLALHMVTKQ